MSHRWLSQKRMSLEENWLKAKVALKPSISSEKSICKCVITYRYWKDWAVTSAIVQNSLQNGMNGEPGQIPKMRSGISTDRLMVLVGVCSILFSFPPFYIRLLFTYPFFKKKIYSSCYWKIRRYRIVKLINRRLCKTKCL